MEPHCDRDLVLVTLNLYNEQKKELWKKPKNETEKMKKPQQETHLKTPGASETGDFRATGTACVEGVSKKKNRFKLISERDKTHPKA